MSAQKEATMTIIYSHHEKQTTDSDTDSSITEFASRPETEKYIFCDGEVKYLVSIFFSFDGFDRSNTSIPPRLMKISVKSFTQIMKPEKIEDWKTGARVRQNEIAQVDIRPHAEALTALLVGHHSQGRRDWPTEIVVNYDAINSL